MTSVAQKTKRNTSRKSTKKIPTRTPIEPTRNFTPEEAAFAAGVAAVTVRRAIDLWQRTTAQGLAHYRVGRRIVISGAQIQAWLDAGGKTGRSIEDVRREAEQAEARKK